MELAPWGDNRDCRESLNNCWLCRTDELPAFPNRPESTFSNGWARTACGWGEAPASAGTTKSSLLLSQEICWGRTPGRERHEPLCWNRDRCVSHTTNIFGPFCGATSEQTGWGSTGSLFEAGKALGLEVRESTCDWSPYKTYWVFGILELQKVLLQEERHSRLTQAVLRVRVSSRPSPWVVKVAQLVSVRFLQLTVHHPHLQMEAVNGKKWLP